MLFYIVCTNILKLLLVKAYTKITYGQLWTYSSKHKIKLFFLIYKIKLGINKRLDCTKCFLHIQNNFENIKWLSLFLNKIRFIFIKSSL